MTDANAERIDEVLTLLRKAQRTLNEIDGGENEHLLVYASDGILSAEGYLGTFRRRLDDPEAD